MARHRSGSYRRAAEQHYKHKVDIEVIYPGLGQRLNKMHDWCRDHAAPNKWAAHGYMEKPNSIDVPKDFMRFYFDNFATAEVFVDTWGGQPVEE